MASSSSFVCLDTILVLSLCILIAIAEEDISANQVAVSKIQTEEVPKSATPRDRFLSILAPFVRVGIFGESAVAVRAPFTNVLVGRQPGSPGMLHISVPFFKMSLGRPQE